MTRESVYAHEMGHAQVFFSVQKAIFQTILSSYHIDDGTRSVSQISVLIHQALNASDALCAEESNKSANDATIDWYAKQKRWHFLEELNGGEIIRWIKE